LQDNNVFRVRKVRNIQKWRINEHRSGGMVCGDILFDSKEEADKKAAEANSFEIIDDFINGPDSPDKTKWRGQFTTWCNKK
jgi:hypothetical protein